MDTRTRRPQTEAMRLYIYTTYPFSRTMKVTCVWCGQDAGIVNLLDIGEVQIWIKRGKLCTMCYDKQMEAWDE